MTPYWAGDGVSLHLGGLREALPALGVTADLVLARRLSQPVLPELPEVESAEPIPIDLGGGS